MWTACSGGLVIIPKETDPKETDLTLDDDCISKEAACLGFLGGTTSLS